MNTDSPELLEQQAVIEAMSKQVGFKPESVKLAAPVPDRGESRSFADKISLHRSAR